MNPFFMGAYYAWLPLIITNCAISAVIQSTFMRTEMIYGLR